MASPFLGIEMHWSGDLLWIKRAIERTNPAELKRHVFDPWIKWVLEWRIPGMYAHKGRVSGADGQMQWRALSPATKAQKEGPANTPLVSSASPTSNKMMRAYKVITRKLHGMGYRFTISNEARSTSKYSRGFDYPSAQHLGWPDYEVKPRADGPGFLAWPLKSGGWAFARHTHPKGAPGRPHIRFFGYDVAKLGKLAMEFILTGRTTELGHNESMT